VKRDERSTQGRVISECVIGTAELTNLDDFFPSLNCFVFPGREKYPEQKYTGNMEQTAGIPP
jgi:hypothetical protein